MIKLYQTRFGENVGNCFTACVCCILEIPDVESVPVFCSDKENWYKIFSEWLHKHYGLYPYILDLKRKRAKQILKGHWAFKIKLPVIICGPTHGGMHAVVYCEDNTIWNTNPSNPELLDIYCAVHFAYSCLSLGTIDDLEL